MKELRGYCRFRVDNDGLLHPYFQALVDRVELEDCWLYSNLWTVLLRKPLIGLDPLMVWRRVRCLQYGEEFKWGTYPAVLAEQIYIEIE